jgi:hypothetical protein
MLHAVRLVGEFFARLEKLDEAIAAAVAAGRCQHCEGPLHRSDYQRKPRGALLAVTGETFTIRHSLCCGRRGCRKRATPPSLRFLGRRVYLEVVVIVASMVAQTMVMTARAAIAVTGVSLRTLRRWAIGGAGLFRSCRCGWSCGLASCPRHPMRPTCLGLWLHASLVMALDLAPPLTAP